MRAITIQNPYAWAVAYDLKPVENRGRQHPWASAVGEDVAIHAGKAWHDFGLDDSRVQQALLKTFPHDDQVHTDGGWRRFLRRSVPSLLALDGKVVAVRRLRDVHDPAECPSRHGGASWTEARCDGWAEPDQWHLVFESGPRLPTPIPCRGYQGLWTLPTDVEAAVQSQVALAGAR